MRHRTFGLLLPLAALALLALGVGRCATVETGTAVGAAGGVVTTDDGVLSLEVPPGALSIDTAITIKRLDADSRPQPPDGLDFVGDVYALAPDGLVFDEPVTVEWRIDLAAAGIDLDRGHPLLLPVSRSDEHTWTTLYGTTFTTYDGQANVFSPMTTLGEVGLLEGPGPAPPAAAEDVLEEALGELRELRTVLETQLRRELDEWHLDLSEATGALVRRSDLWDAIDRTVPISTRIGPLGTNVEPWIRKFDRSLSGGRLIEDLPDEPLVPIDWSALPLTYPEEPTVSVRLDLDAVVVLGPEADEHAREALARLDAERSGPDDIEAVVGALRPIVVLVGDPGRDYLNRRIAHHAERVASEREPVRPPRVSGIVATFDWPVTTYRIEATHPDGHELTFAWDTDPFPLCGLWTTDGPVAHWSHPHPPCPEEEVHPATISVTVSDEHGHAITAIYPFGSAVGQGDPPEPLVDDE